MRQSYIKIIYILTVLVSAWACQSDDDIGAFTPDEEQININIDEITIEKEGADNTISVTANLPWRAESNESWVKVKTKQGEGTGDLSYSVDPNPKPESRSAEISVWITQNSKVKFTVFQEQGDLPPDTSQNIYVKPNGSGDGSNWDNATSLDIALSMGLFDGDNIHLASGTYVPSNAITGGDESNANDLTFEITNNINLIGGYPSDPIEDDVADPALHETILSGDVGGGAYANHVVVISAPLAPDAQVELNGLIIKDGNANGSGNNNINSVDYPKNHGGGIIMAKSKVKLNFCQVSNNKAIAHGVGMYVFENAEVSIANSKIVSNIGATSNGAAMYLRSAKAFFTDTTIENNSTDGVAGAIQTYGSATLHMYNSTIANNISGSGGTSGRRAGALYNRDGSHAVLVNCTIYGNSATGLGGAINTHGSSTTDILSSTITANSGIGGGINNTAGCIVNIYNSIVSGNLENGAASDIIGEVTLKNTILGNGVFGDDGAQVSGEVFEVDNMLDVLKNNGGNTYTCKLLENNNPARNHGMNATQLQVLGTGFDPFIPETITTIDQIGNSRIGVEVIGAFIE